MHNDEYITLKEIFNELVKEKKEENKKLQSNLNCIKQIDIYLNSIKEDSDFHFFSPRSAENIYADKIKENKNERSYLENNNKSLYHKLNKLDKQIRQLEILLENNSANYIDDCNSFEVLDIQESERQRISRELHDSSVQNLTHLIHLIELSSMFIDQDPIRAKLELENCIRILRSTVDEMRKIIFNFRPMPFDDLGFKQCIENFVIDSKTQYKNCEIVYDICDLENEDWKDNDEQEFNLFLITVYRVIQEAVINSLKHSNADTIFLKVKTKNKKCYININDNGKGFSLNNILKEKDKHFGLTIMKERISLLKGDLLINTELGKGTEIKIEIPLK